MELRNERLKSLHEIGKPKISVFLEGIIDNIDELGRISDERKANWSKPIVFQTIDNDFA